MCELSGFQINHQSINCYDGQPMKQSFKPKNIRRTSALQSLQTFIHDIQNVMNNIYIRYLRFHRWQQLLILCGISWFVILCLSSAYVLMKRLYFYLISEEISIVNDTDFEGSIVNKKELREKRLKFLVKKQLESDLQENIEQKIANILGTGMGINDGGVGNECNVNENENDSSTDSDVPKPI